MFDNTVAGEAVKYLRNTNFSAAMASKSMKEGANSATHFPMKNLTALLSVNLFIIFCLHFELAI